MYESPITLITEPMYNEMLVQGEKCILKTIQGNGVNVDTEELMRALQYDRDQYEQGYRDGINTNKWVRINSDFDLPSNRGNYIAYTGNDSTPEVLTLYYEGDDNWDDGMGVAKGSWYGITHWQPLPEPPKED